LSGVGTFHAQVYGEIVSVHKRLLFTLNSTFVTPMLSEAEAVIVTVVLRVTLLPLIGLVIDTVGFVVSKGVYLK
jgi:hypothetical protein